MFGSGSSSRSAVGTRTRRRRSYTRSIGYGNAWKKTKRIKAINGRPKVGKRFRKKVEKVLDYDKPFGVYTYISDARLLQTTRDEWGLCVTDNNAKSFDQFTCLQFWDAASILFNEKTMGNDWESNTSQGAGNNIRYKQPLHIINSYTAMEFKSTSSHVITVEMYICSPKGNAITDTPATVANNSSNDYNNGYSYLNTSYAVTSGTFDILRNEGSMCSMWTQLHKQFSVQKVVLKFNPGEHKRHFIQGPKNFTIDGSKYATDAGTSLGTSRFQKQIFFRTINDPTVSGVNTGTTGTNTVGRWPSNYQGGVAFRQKRTMRIRLPDNTDFSTVTKAGDLKQNTYKQGHWVRIDTKDVDQQVCVENPVVLSTTSVPQ